MVNEKKEAATTETMLRNGAILTEYTKEYLLSVNPAFGIDRVRWSIVKQGTGGKEHRDFYMKLPLFRCLIKEIDNYLAAKKLAADANSNFPSAYNYVTGENGSKKLSIGGGSKIPCRVQIQEKVNEKWERMMVGIPMEALTDMSFLFKLVSGEMLCRKGSYLDKLYDAYWQGEADRSKRFSSYNPVSDGDYVENESTATASQPKPVQAEAPKPEAKQPVPEPKSETKTAEKPITVKAETPAICLLVESDIGSRGGQYFCSVMNDTGDAATLWMSADAYSKAKALIKKGATIHCSAEAKEVKGKMNYNLLALQ